MKLWPFKRKTIRVDREALQELELHNIRLVESNEVLKDDVRELQGQLADCRERVEPEPKPCPVCGSLLSYSHKDGCRFLLF